MGLLPFSVRIEAWDKKGENLGFVVHSIQDRGIDGAIVEARKMYKKYYQGSKDKQITIFYKLDLVWRWNKNGIQEWENAEIRKSLT